MTQGGPLQWAAGGWLVLVGSSRREQMGEVDDRLLALADFSNPIAFLPSAGTPLAHGERLLDDYAAWGGPHGSIVPILDPAGARDPECQRALAEAGTIILGDGDPRVLLRVLRESPALDKMALALAHGAMVVGYGAGAEVLGEWVVLDRASGECAPGWGWVSGAVIRPRFAGSAQEPGLQAVLRERPGLVGIGIPEGAALALGPTGQVETWGQGEVTVVVAPQEG